jgi:hypothetical protein
MLQAQFRPEDLDWAGSIADVLLAQFEDRDAGGFWFTSHDHERLILRTKPGHDNATPSGNGIAALQLQRLGHLVGEPRYLDAAGRALRLFHQASVRQPSGFASLDRALSEYLEPPSVVIVRGPATAIGDWSRAIGGHYLPSTLVLALPTGLQGLPESLDKPAGAAVNAWVCRGVVCLPPTDEVATVLRELGTAA